MQRKVVKVMVPMNSIIKAKLSKAGLVEEKDVAFILLRGFKNLEHYNKAQKEGASSFCGGVLKTQEEKVVGSCAYCKHNLFGDYCAVMGYKIAGEERCKRFDGTEEAMLREGEMVEAWRKRRAAWAQDMAAQLYGKLVDGINKLEEKKRRARRGGKTLSEREVAG